MVDMTASGSWVGKWDAVIVGGGHNGLVAGAFLAKAGLRTVVLKSRPSSAEPSPSSRGDPTSR